MSVATNWMIAKARKLANDTGEVVTLVRSGNGKGIEMASVVFNRSELALMTVLPSKYFHAAFEEYRTQVAGSVARL